MNLIHEPWPWYVAGPMIALTMFLLLYSGKHFGMSSNLRTICSMGGAGKMSSFFQFDWKKEHFRKCNLEAVKHSFAESYLKEKLRGQIEKDY